MYTKIRIINSKNLKLENNEIQPIYEYFVNKEQIIDIENYDLKNLKIFSHHVLDKIINNDESWKEMVPEEVANIIEKQKLFTKKV